jgi:hypothetical protein
MKTPVRRATPVASPELFVAFAIAVVLTEPVTTVATAKLFPVVLNASCPLMFVVPILLPLVHVITVSVRAPIHVHLPVNCVPPNCSSER